MGMYQSLIDYVVRTSDYVLKPLASIPQYCKDSVSNIVAAVAVVMDTVT